MQTTNDQVHQQDEELRKYAVQMVKQVAEMKISAIDDGPSDSEESKL